MQDAFTKSGYTFPEVEKVFDKICVARGWNPVPDEPAEEVSVGDDAASEASGSGAVDLAAKMSGAVQKRLSGDGSKRQRRS